MGQKSSTSKRANKFQPSIEAKGKHVGTFHSGLDEKKIQVSEIPVGGDRGSGHVDTQFGLAREPVVGHKQTATRDPEQQGWDYFADNFTSNPYTQQESKPGDKKACVVAGITYDYHRAIGAYPPDARIVAPLREARIDFGSLLIPEQNNIMTHTTYMYEANSQHDGYGRNEALLQDKPIIRCFVKNMEPDVPYELVTIERQ